MNHGTTFDRLRSRRTIALVALAAVLVTGTIVGQSADRAYAVDYPSWGDVQAARNNVAAKQKEIAKLDDALAALASQVSAAQQLAEQKGTEFQVAQQKHDEAAFKLTALQEQAKVAQKKADDSKQKAATLVAQLARVGGGSDVSSTIFFSGDDSKKLLAKLGLATLVKDQSAGIYEKAVQDQNTAESLSSQADVAEKALKALADDAQKAMDEANAASEKAQAALAEQQDNKGRLEAQRAALVSNQAITEASYNQGVQERARIKAEQDRQAALAAAAYAAAHPASSGGGGGTPAGSVGGSGWAKPAQGRVVDPYGMRTNPVTGIWTLHAGADLGAACGTPIWAANSGTVTFAGLSGGYGNFVIVTGGGVSTAYGHIMNGGTLVTKGQTVSAGQQIAKVGSTGNSTGCHLHFETRPGGTAVDPVPFMAARGVTL